MFREALFNSFIPLSNCVWNKIQQEWSSSWAKDYNNRIANLGSKSVCLPDTKLPWTRLPPVFTASRSWVVQIWKDEWILPDGVVHPGHSEECSKIRRVGGAHDEGEEPPAAHHDAHGHGVHWGFATCGRPAHWIGPGLPLSLPSPQKYSTLRPGLGNHHWGWAGEQRSDLLAGYGGPPWQFWERIQRSPISERDEGPPDTKKMQDWPLSDVVSVKMPRIEFWISKSSSLKTIYLPVLNFQGCHPMQDPFPISNS